MPKQTKEQLCVCDLFFKIRVRWQFLTLHQFFTQPLFLGGCITRLIRFQLTCSVAMTGMSKIFAASSWKEETFLSSLLHPNWLTRFFYDNRHFPHLMLGSVRSGKGRAKLRHPKNCTTHTLRHWPWENRPLNWTCLLKISLTYQSFGDRNYVLESVYGWAEPFLHVTQKESRFLQLQVAQPDSHDPDLYDQVKSHDQQLQHFRDASEIWKKTFRIKEQIQIKASRNLFIVHFLFYCFNQTVHCAPMFLIFLAHLDFSSCVTKEKKHGSAQWGSGKCSFSGEGRFSLTQSQGLCLYQLLLVRHCRRISISCCYFFRETQHSLLTFKVLYYRREKSVSEVLHTFFERTNLIRKGPIFRGADGRHFSPLSCSCDACSQCA